ncbi:transcriptional regulator, TetR family [Pseudoxanthomonas sp. GM95]|uniref:TetR/AcrR family transcriptional regulator n=1 Tax=Pseudoxanthomonas sp. GM95 TaxID=1881043 RepID=UPI0008C07260|nr:TetR/AcrR family transcriptional regulator [Pseudoxanthomonas sp. GM95]SEM27199.1 transcriptional regulator, TetR family [Pseudoxanthomonas sp. GM95]
MSALPDALQARKQPLQSRSKATVEAIREASFQVLIAHGLAGSTTTRVAERAGVSVGTLYQYYRNRSTMLAALLEWHLDTVATAVEDAGARVQGATLDDTATAIVEAFVAAKLEHEEISLALYAIAEMHGGPALVAAGRVRMEQAIIAMLGATRDARFADAPQVAGVLLGALVGPMCDLLNAGAPADRVAPLRMQLTLLARGYLAAARVQA